MKFLNTVINVLLAFSSLTIIIVVLDAFTNILGLGSKIPNSIDEYVGIGLIILLVVSLIGKIIVGISLRAKSPEQYDTNIKKGNLLLSFGFGALTIFIHAFYFLFIGMNCSFGGGDALERFLGFGSIMIGIVLSFEAGVRLSKISVEGITKRVLLYILANVAAPILMIITLPSYFDFDFDIGYERQDVGVPISMTRTLLPHQDLGKYRLNVISDGKILEIKERENIITHLEIKDLPTFSDDDPDWQNNYTFVFFGTYDGPQNTTLYDSKRNEVYFRVVNYPISGNANLSQALYVYNFNTKTTRKIVDIFGTGLNQIYISPGYNYLVYNEGYHGGTCQDMANLKVMDLNDLKIVGSTQFEFGIDTLGNNVPLEHGYTTFGGWIDDTSFRYIQHFEKIEGCSEGGLGYANEKSPMREKVFTIKK